MCWIFDIFPKFSAIARVRLAGFCIEVFFYIIRVHADRYDGHVDFFVDKVGLGLFFCKNSAYEFMATDNCCGVYQPVF